MRNRIKIFSAHVFLALALFTNLSVASGTSLSIPATQINYTETGIGPIKVAPGYGDMTKEAHSNFVKIPGGFNSPPHFHTEDYYAVVVSGVIGNGMEGAQDIPLPPGSYWFQNGNEKHVTKCLSSNECVFFVTQPGKFDFVMSK